jgi:c(7)-type cytochrome triheme protein
MTVFRNLAACFAALCFCLLCGRGAAADDKKPPEKLIFQAKPGKVTFNHAAHLKRENNNCKVCHNKLFQESAKAPLDYKAAMHKSAETAKTSCAFCHSAGAKAFESKGNCAKCHVKD